MTLQKNRLNQGLEEKCEENVEKGETYNEVFEKCTLIKVDVFGKVVGNFGSFEVIQEFRNDSDESYNLVYTFPLSSTAAVTSFEADINGKILKGIIKEKEEAMKEYQKAIANGDSAYLLDNVENNTFRVNLGRVLGKETVKLKLTYIDKFEVFKNKFDLRIPTIIPPRYNDLITACERYSDNVNHTIDFKVVFDDSMKIKDINSATHNIKQVDNTITTKDARMNKDFVLQVELDNDMKQTVVVNGNYGIIQKLPVFDNIETQEIKDITFIVDCSGSMSGEKILKTKKALVKCINSLIENDTYRIICFGSSYRICNNIDVIDANMGGTEIWEPIEYALTNYKHTNIVLITDGQVGNENELANEIRKIINDSHIFVFGIDTSINTSGLDKIAEAGNGKAEYITLNEKIDEKIIRQFVRIKGSNLRNIKLSDELKDIKIVKEFAESNIVFSGDFWTCVFKYEGSIKTNEYEVINTELPIDKFFGKANISYIENLITSNRYGYWRDNNNSNKGYEEEIIKISLDYQISSKYTSFLVINERENKILDIPKFSQVTQDHPDSWNLVIGHRSAPKQSYSHDRVLRCCCEFIPSPTSLRVDKQILEWIKSVKEFELDDVIKNFSNYDKDEIINVINELLVKNIITKIGDKYKLVV